MVRTQTGKMNFSPEIDRGGAYLPDDTFRNQQVSSSILLIGSRIRTNGYGRKSATPCSYSGDPLPEAWGHSKSHHLL